MDGASSLRVVWHVVFPAARPAMAVLGHADVRAGVERLPVADHRAQPDEQPDRAGGPQPARPRLHPRPVGDHGGRAARHAAAAARLRCCSASRSSAASCRARSRADARRRGPAAAASAPLHPFLPPTPSLPTVDLHDPHGSASMPEPATPVTFPPAFLWGAATSAYQIEGAVREDGRTPSIWDTFSHTPGKTAGGETGDIAVDHYHRYRDDVALMADLGLTAYRFSVSWPGCSRRAAAPRSSAAWTSTAGWSTSCSPTASSRPLTLYHWDLPQELEDAGGWPERDTALALRRVRADRRRGAGRPGGAAGSRSTSPGAAPSWATAPGCTLPAARTRRRRCVPRTTSTWRTAWRLRRCAPRCRPATAVAVSLNSSVVRPRYAGPGRPGGGRAASTTWPTGSSTARCCTARTRRTCSRTRRRSRTGRSSWTAISRLINQPLDALGLNYYTPTLVSAPPRPRRTARARTATARATTPPGRARTTSPSTRPRASARRWAGRSTRRACTT